MPSKEKFDKRQQTVENLRTGFEEAEKSYPGVCKMFLDEIVFSLTGQRPQGHGGGSGSGSEFSHKNPSVRPGSWNLYLTREKLLYITIFFKLFYHLCKCNRVVITRIFENTLRLCMSVLSKAHHCGEMGMLCKTNWHWKVWFAVTLLAFADQMEKSWSVDFAMWPRGWFGSSQLAVIEIDQDSSNWLKKCYLAEGRKWRGDRWLG